MRPFSDRTPYLADDRLETQAVLVFAPQLYLGRRVFLLEPQYPHGELFLKASCSCLLAFLWRGLGTLGLLPSFLIYSQPLCFFWLSTLPVLRSIHSPTLGEFHIPPSGGGLLSASLSSSCCSALSSARSLAPGFW